MRPAALILLLASSLAPIASAAQTFTGLGIPADAVTTLGSDVSGDGSVVSGVVVRSGPSQEAARWTPGGIELLGFLPLPNQNSAAQGISDDGTTVVGFSGGRAFRWQGGAMTNLGLLPGTNGAGALAVSADGTVVVGKAATGSANLAFRWTQSSGMVGLGDLPGGATNSNAFGVSADGNSVVGASLTGSGQEAFLWTQASGMIGLGDLDGGNLDSLANGISADGVWVVGQGTTAAGVEAMRWSEATGMLPLGLLPGADGSSASDVSGDGSVIVGSSSGVAFVWDELHGMRDLKGVLEDFGLDLTGWHLLFAAGVSTDGLTLVGDGVNPDGRSEAWIAVIPEPTPVPSLSPPGAATLVTVLLASGVVGLAAIGSVRRCR